MYEYQAKLILLNGFPSLFSNIILYVLALRKTTYLRILLLVIMVKFVKVDKSLENTHHQLF